MHADITQSIIMKASRQRLFILTFAVYCDTINYMDHLAVAGSNIPE